MSDDPQWFSPKRYGYGAGMPISWQGWALTIGFFAAAFGIAVSLRNKPVAAIAGLVPLAFAFTVIAAKTTRGGWHWRWGEKD